MPQGIEKMLSLSFKEVGMTINLFLEPCSSLLTRSLLLLAQVKRFYVTRISCLVIKTYLSAVSIPNINEYVPVTNLVEDVLTYSPC